MGEVQLKFYSLKDNEYKNIGALYTDTSKGICFNFYTSRLLESTYYDLPAFLSMDRDRTYCISYILGNSFSVNAHNLSRSESITNKEITQII